VRIRPFLFLFSTIVNLLLVALGFIACGVGVVSDLLFYAYSSMQDFDR